MTRLDRTDEGFTLVEMLVTIALLGMAMVAIVSAIMTSIVTSDVHRKQATGETVMRGYAEQVKREAVYTSCATTYPVAFSPRPGYTTSLVGVDYWDAAASTWKPQPAPNCATEDTVQRVLLETATDDGRTAESVEVVVRRP